MIKKLIFQLSILTLLMGCATSKKIILELESVRIYGDDKLKHSQNKVLFEQSGVYYNTALIVEKEARNLAETKLLYSSAKLKYNLALKLLDNSQNLISNIKNQDFELWKKIEILKKNIHESKSRILLKNNRLSWI